jgi:hypothetical protein
MLIQLDSDIAPFDLCAVQSLFRTSCVFLSPKFNHAGVFTKTGMGVR